MAIIDPLSRYRAESTAYQAIDLVPGTSGVVTISGLSSVADGSVAIDLGSNVFRFYGASFSGNNQLYVSENGLISFGGAESDPSNNNLFGYEAYRIAPLWDDWVTNRNTSVNDLVLYQFRDLNSDGTTDQLVIEWNNVYNNNVPESDGATFQVILSLNTGTSNGDIVFNYVDLAVDGDSGDGNFNNGGSATIGIRSGQSGTVNTPLLVSVDGQQYNAYDQLITSTLPVSSGSAIRISTVPNPSSPAPALVKDINTVRIGSNPSQLRVFNGALYVVADNGVSGDELLRIDASGASSLVRDVYPGPAGSGVRGLTVVGSNLFFLAFDDTNEYGVWKSDGTTAGTTLVRSGLSSITRDFNSATTVAASSGKFFFRGYDDTNGLELWVSDGTTAGTLRISNIEAGSGWSEPDNLTDVNGTLYFTATTSAGGRELYKSGGTAATTVLVRAIASGAPSSDPRELLNLNGTLYFTANDGASGRELWKSDGTSATTVTVRNINTTAGTGSDPLNLTILGSTLYFFANSGSGYQLWKSDGTSAGTVRVSTSIFNADYWSNYNFHLTNINGTLYFSQQGATTTELWKSNGSTVSKVADLPSYFSFISGFTNVGGILYFNLGDSDASTGSELWKSDGTAAGTMLVRDVVPGTASSNPRELTAFNNKLYFIAASENAFRTEELWSSDGTPEGTVSLELDPRTVGADISSPLMYNGNLYFAANDGLLGKELWTSDGTAAGTQLIKDVNTGGPGSEIKELIEMGGNLYFFAYDNTNGFGLWKSNGSGAGTTLVRSLLEYSNSPIISAGNRIYFNSYSSTAGWELWSSDGTAAGTALLRNINPGAADSDPGLVKNAVLGNTFFFTAFDPSNGRELWKTNGTTAGTSLVRNINPGAEGSDPNGLIVFNGALYFAAYDPTYGSELWKTDGTTTTRVKNINPGAAGSNPQSFAIFQGSLYFTAADATGWQLWKTDGSTAGTTRVTSFNYWVGPMAQLTAVNSTLFFTTNNGSELWKTDGTMAGTTMMSGAPWASLGSSAALSDLTNVNGVLYFAAFDATNGRELWRSDGTAEGTFRVTDLNPQAPLGAGLGNANPSNLIYDASRNKLFFTASNWQSGGENYGNNELFSIDINNPPTDIALSVSNFDENIPANSVVGNFTSADPDTANTFTYSLVAGSGSTDNSAFTIAGNQLQINASPDFETKSTYNIRVHSTDQGGLSFEKALTLAVNNVNEAPTDLVFGGSGSVDENAGLALLLGSLSTIDPDSPITPQRFTYSLVSGGGDTDNAAFSVVGNQLLLKASADFETKSSYSLRLRSSDQGGLFTEKVLSISVNNLNDAPTDLALSASSVNENVAANTVIGSFSSTDQDAGNTFTYSLVSGTGATDNSSFNIAGNQLRINARPNFEVKNSFSIRVRSTDQSGAFVEKVLPITINNLNETPTNISLSASSVNENIPAGSLVGTLSSTDPDSSRTPQSFSYRLVAGTGSTDNTAFEIQENELRLRAAPDFELKSSYSIRIQTRDQGNLLFAKAFTITVNNQNDAPTDLALSASSVNENVAANTVIGSFSSTDQDAGNTFTYSLVSGAGDADNSAFNILGTQLRINSSPDFETKNNYSIRVRTVDQGGLSVEKALTISVNNLNEAPTDLVLSGSGTVNENAGPALVLGSLSSIDPDSPLTPQGFSYSLASGTGDTDNAAFSVVANQLLLNASADFETKSSYSLRLRSTDQGGLFTEKVLSIAVNNLNDAPTDLALSASSVNENVAANTVIGSFSSTDQDAGNTFTYSLVSGTGATDNSSFNIAGNQLRINARPNFEVKNSFSIRVRSTDQSGAFVEKVLPITINNLNETPTNISLSASSVNENIPAGSLVGTLSSTDPDSSRTPQSFSYRLVAGTGSTDNAAFEIQENELRLRAAPDFELKSSYSIRIQTRDQGNLLFTKVFTITVNNVNEEPTNGTDFYTATTAVDVLQGFGGNDGFFVGISGLNSGDVFDGGADVDRLDISGGNSSQVLTMNLNQANQFVSLTGSTFSPLPIFTGFEDVNLAGFAGAGVLIGDSSANQFTGSSRKDSLTGNAGADIFKLNTLSHSLLSAFDVITDYSNEDRVDAPGAIAATLTASSGNVAGLTSAAVTGLLTSSVLPANAARAFTVTGQSGTFIALNNGTAGFSGSTDAILHLPGFAISALNPVTII
jgi:ELWxxDGT repeat protein